MRNVQKSFLDKRLPAYLGIFVLFLTLITTIWLSSNTILFATKATIGSTAKNIQIANISDTSFTVTYLTDAIATGNIAYGNVETMGEIALDDRDKKLGNPMEYRMHFITIDQLKPSTKYYFTIASGTQVTNNNGVPFEVVTSPQDKSAPPNNGTANGSVAFDDGTLPPEGLVTLSTDKSQLLVSILQPDGSYYLPLATLRSKENGAQLSITPDTKLNIQINTPLLQSKATLLASQINPIPKIILSKDYDFTLSPDPLLSTTSSTSGQTASSSASFPLFETPVVVTSPQITTPQNDQQFKDNKPVFKGKALPNTSIKLVINSQQEIIVELQSDSNGLWEFRPPVALDPGTHTITISSVDVNGILQKLSRSFVVYAQGSQFTDGFTTPGVATPTITPPVIPTLTITPSPTPTLPQTNLVPSPTIGLSITPTIQPTRTPITPTGNSTIINGIIGAVTAIGIGALLFLFTAI